MSKIIYIRHGQASIFSDNYDQLSEIGYKQSEFLGSYFNQRNIVFDKVYMGPLARHEQTTTGIFKSCNKNGTQIEVLEGLREHQGFTALKSLLPSLIQNDDSIKELVDKSWTNRKEKIAHHIRIYENFAMRWAKGEFDELTNGIQNWNQFVQAASEAHNHITEKSIDNSTTLVVTSGGPKAVACGNALKQNNHEMMETSWEIYNCSISEFQIVDDEISLQIFNDVSYLEMDEMKTLV